MPELSRLSGPRSNPCSHGQTIACGICGFNTLAPAEPPEELLVFVCEHAITLADDIDRPTGGKADDPVICTRCDRELAPTRYVPAARVDEFRSRIAHNDPGGLTTAEGW